MTFSKPIQLSRRKKLEIFLRRKRKKQLVPIDTRIFNSLIIHHFTKGTQVILHNPKLFRNTHIKRKRGKACREYDNLIFQTLNLTIFCLRRKMEKRELIFSTLGERMWLEKPWTWTLTRERTWSWNQTTILWFEPDKALSLSI